MKQILIFAGILFFSFTEGHSIDNNHISISGPDGQVTFQVFVDDQQSLGYNIFFMGERVIDSSLLGVTVDYVELGKKVSLGNPERYEINEAYPWRGIIHSAAVNHCFGAKIPVTHSDTKIKYTLDVRVFNDGIAFCYEIPGKGSRIVSGEATSFNIPDQSKVWYHNFRMHYEGQHEKKDISGIGEGEWAAPPLTFRLPNYLGYAAITESAIVNYSGMGLQADGKNSFKVRLGNEQPVSYPFELRYSKEDINRLAQPAAIEGVIKTPWRVVMIGKDLNTLVNCDVIHSVAPPPDEILFPKGFNEYWMKPGRAVWGYLTDEPRTLEGMKNLSKLAGELGFEYHVVEGHWTRWTFEEQKEFVDYSHKQGVRILLWENSKDLRDPKKLLQKENNESGNLR